MKFNDQPYGQNQCMGPVGDIVSKVGGFLGPLGQVASLISTVGGMVGGNKGPKAPSAPAAAQEAPFSPTKPTAMSRPDSLSTLAGYMPDQERTALATKGTQTGLGKDEDNYYRNLIQRSLIGDDNSAASGNVDDYLKPVESQYFAKQGANTGGVMDFLKSIRGY